MIDIQKAAYTYSVRLDKFGENTHERNHHNLCQPNFYFILIFIIFIIFIFNFYSKGRESEYIPYFSTSYWNAVTIIVLYPFYRKNVYL